MRISLSLLLILLLQQGGRAESPEEHSLPSRPANKPPKQNPATKPFKPDPAPQPSKPDPAPQPSKPDPAPQPSKPDPAPQPSKPDPAPQPSKPDPAPQPSKPDPAPQPSKPDSTFQPKKSAPDWMLQECLNENYTRLSCSKVFCPPWRRCLHGKCVCKLPYQCPRLGRAVCGKDSRPYISFCQTQAIACRTNSAMFSHYGYNCEKGGLLVELKESGQSGEKVVQVDTAKGKVLICGTKSWDMAAANVICRSLNGDARGAGSVQKKMSKVLGGSFPSQCIRVSCTGSEYSLAECTIYEPQDVKDNTQIGLLNCYQKPAPEGCSEFRCVNGKCISWGHTCDGVDHCGDYSDEMCCSDCQKNSFHCKSGVCIPQHAVQDGIRDCLGGEDEVHSATRGPVKKGAKVKKDKDKATGTDSQKKPVTGEADTEVKDKDEGSHADPKLDKAPDSHRDSHRDPERGGSHADPKLDEAPDSHTDSHRDPERGEADTEVKKDKDEATGTDSHKKTEKGDSHIEPKQELVWWSPKEDILEVRNHTESQLECGIPNMDYVYKTEEETRRNRRKRVVGGQESLPTQIQWQVAVEEDRKIHCGGVYLGGCWVLTAAHCVRPKPRVFRIKFSLWKKLTLLNTTDIIPVKKIIIHENYDPRTYQNDIALVQLQELAFKKECLHPNPAVRPVCVPWSPLQFQHGDTCTISGWGRNKEGDSANALKWANVTIIGNCKNYYKDRFFDGMECAGDLQGKVDTCQGDSGGPLVCKDASGLSYVWGIVSWGEKCGEPGYPGVYTKVAHYFEWIRFNTGWPAVTKYNH